MLPTATTPGKLSFDDLMTKGYFPDRVIPPVNSMGLSVALADLLAYIRPIAKGMLKSPSKLRSRCVTHSVPKRKHLRRSLSIPNPLHQCMAAAQIATEWRALHKFCLQSPLSLSVPILGGSRAIVARDDLSRQPLFRAQRSVGARYLLKTDIARFYPSIYTHSIPWALHGKDAARRDSSLYGNDIDERVRESQDKQTGGVPIGPDTSYLIAEVIATSIDIAMEKRVGTLHGTRFIDDYHLYFDSYNDAEAGLAALHEAAASLELEVNDLKTEIIPTPE